MAYSVQISFSRYQEIVDECKPLQNILNSDDLFEIESLANLKDYLEEKRDAIEANTYIDSMRMSASKTKVQQLKESRFKGEKKMVDSFVITGVNKLVILTYQKKESGGKFNFIWAEYLN
jgi:hypothetical protein